MASDALTERGPKNSLTDVGRIRVGHVTLVSGDGALVPGLGPVRTGVTAIVPEDDIYEHKCAAGVHVINGFGKMTGISQVEELGRLETPIALTSTLCVWHAADGIVEYLLRRHPDLGRTGPPATRSSASAATPASTTCGVATCARSTCSTRSTARQTRRSRRAPSAPAPG